MASDESFHHHSQIQESEPEFSDACLVYRAKNGEEGAFQQLFERHYGAVQRLATRILLDGAIAEDVAQETFIRAARSLASIPKADGFRSWLFRVATNLCRDQIRSKLRRGTREAEYANLVTSGEKKAEAFAFKVVDAIATLPLPQREAVVLVYYENLSHSEAAQVASCAPSTISWRLMLAKRKLKQTLAHE